MKNLRALALSYMVVLMLIGTYAGSALAGAVCVPQNCYCTGLGCKKFCRDIIIAGGGAGSGSEPQQLGFAVADNVFTDLVSLQIGTGPETRGQAVAVFGDEEDFDRGLVSVAVIDASGNIQNETRANLTEIQVKSGNDQASMDIIVKLLEAKQEHFHLVEIP